MLSGRLFTNMVIFTMMAKVVTVSQLFTGSMLPTEARDFV